MAFTAGEKAFCVLEFHSRQSIISVQRFFRREYGKDPPTDKTIHAWYTQFKETSCLCKKKSTGRLSTSPGDVERVRQLYQRSPQKSTHRASRELSMSQPTELPTSIMRFADT